MQDVFQQRRVILLSRSLVKTICPFTDPSVYAFPHARFHELFFEECYHNTPFHNSGAQLVLDLPVFFPAYLEDVGHLLDGREVGRRERERVGTEF